MGLRKKHCMRWKEHLRYIFLQNSLLCSSVSLCLLVHACLLPLSKKIELYGKQYAVWHLHQIIEADLHKNGASEHHVWLKFEGNTNTLFLSICSKFAKLSVVNMTAEKY